MVTNATNTTNVKLVELPKDNLKTNNPHCTCIVLEVMRWKLKILNVQFYWTHQTCSEKKIVKRKHTQKSHITFEAF